MREISCFQEGQALLSDLQSGGSHTVSFCSLPAAAGQIGPLVWLSLLEQLQAEFPQMEIEAWLDCADDAGYALAALDEGCKALCLSGSQEVLKKLQEIAALRGARILHRSELDSGSSGR